MKKEDLLSAHRRIQPYIHRTPVLTCQTLDALSGATLFFKCENFQKMGAFKMRGAANAILQLSEGARQNGVATHSSGNFAQALSLAAKMLGVKAYIVMPSNSRKSGQVAMRTFFAHSMSIRSRFTYCFIGPLPAVYG